MALILPVIFAFFVTLIAFYPTILFAKKFNLVDNPKIREHPAHIQNRIVPRAGGLACFIGLLASILLFLPIEKHIIGLILGLTVLLTIGLLDDKLKKLSPYSRLLVQILAAGLVVGSGVGISYITNPLGGIIRLDSIVIPVNLLGPHFIILIADLLAFFWIVWVLNMLNWAKGVDGQMPGIVMVAALILGLLSYKLFLAGDPQQLNITKLSFITFGVSGALLAVNWYPAKIFPGFSGSNVLGLMIATLAILSGARLATALLVLLVPATDFVYTFIRRILSGKNPVWGDNKHLHHLLLQKGFSHRKIALFYMLGSAILGATALTLDSKGKFFAAILVTAIILGTILWLNFFGRYLGHSDQDSG